MQLLHFSIFIYCCMFVNIIWGYSLKDRAMGFYPISLSSILSTPSKLKGVSKMNKIITISMFNNLLFIMLTAIPMQNNAEITEYFTIHLIFTLLLNVTVFIHNLVER